MLGHNNLNPLVPWSVDRIQATFADPGVRRTTIGTGFWVIASDGTPLFVTNRHLVDASLAFPGEVLRLERVELALRPLGLGAPGLYYAPGEWCAVSRLAETLYVSREWDVAIFVKPSFAGNFDAARHRAIPVIQEADLADRDWFRTTLAMMDECYFIGYPGTPKEQSKTGEDIWHYDTRSQFPIARHAIIASQTDIPFSNEHVPLSAGAILVSGMSFHGSSGSPVLTPELGIRPGAMPFGVADSHRPARVIGIMSGHFRTKETSRDFDHAGLSYFTRSSCIAWLIEQARKREWGAAPTEFAIEIAVAASGP
jgi:hypothetical protein